jgi:translation initiation factor IF-3
MAHQEFGTQVVERLIKEVVPYGQPDAPPKLVGKGLNVMLSPLPRARRAKNPRPTGEGAALSADEKKEIERLREVPPPSKENWPSTSSAPNAGESPGFVNAPFAQLEGSVTGRSAA